VSTRETRVTLRCDLCRDSAKPGYLWLGGSDYVECPQCFTTRKVACVETLHTPGRLFASPGLPSSFSNLTSR
jgi:hypothetical protein